MDWSKSKSIFIAVFLILDIFLYTLYLDRHTEAQQYKVLGEKDIEARLKDDNITYHALPMNIEPASYISARVSKFKAEDLQLQNFQNVSIENDSKLLVTMEEPVKLRNINDKTSFTEFVQMNVPNGAFYTLWEVDTENKTATFFQQVNDRTVYYNINGVVTIYWNEEEEVVMYEQTMLENIEAYEEKENLLPPIQVIQALYAKGLLKPDSRIVQMNLGYSTLVQLTQAQVFVPTWEVRVETADGMIEEYFVNAVEGKVIDVKIDLTNVVDVEETDVIE